MRRSRRFVPILVADCRKKKNVSVKHFFFEKKNRKFHQLHKRLSRENAKTRRRKSFLRFIFPTDKIDFRRCPDFFFALKSFVKIRGYSWFLFFNFAAWRLGAKFFAVKNPRSSVVLYFSRVAFFVFL